MFFEVANVATFSNPAWHQHEAPAHTHQGSNRISQRLVWTRFLYQPAPTEALSALQTQPNPGSAATRRSPAPETPALPERPLTKAPQSVRSGPPFPGLIFGRKVQAAYLR